MGGDPAWAERPEGLRLRRPQQLRHGVRPGLAATLDAENGDDTFAELNLVEPGLNGGWIQVMGPLSRVAEFKDIETTSPRRSRAAAVPLGDPSIASTRRGPRAPVPAAGRAYRIRSSAGSSVAPDGIGFLDGRALGPQYEGDLFMGFSTCRPEAGTLFRFDLTGNRARSARGRPAAGGSGRRQRHKYDVTESESLLFSFGFGVVTDIQTWPERQPVRRLARPGAIYEISRR